MAGMLFDEGLMANTHKSYSESIKKATISVGRDALVSYFSKKLPFLFIPVLGPVVTFLIGKMVEILIDKTEFAIFISYIDMRVDAQGSAFSRAAIDNYQAQQNGTPAEKIEAEKKLIQKFRDFVILKR